MSAEQNIETEGHFDDGCPICELMKSGGDINLQKLQEAFLKSSQNPDAIIGFNPELFGELPNEK